MKPICDYHMHTPLCGHATGEPKEYAKQAIKVGLQEIGFSDHAPFVHMRDPGITMGMEQLPSYYRMIEEVCTLYKNELRIKVAIEADFIPGYEDKTKKILDDYPYDYVIGSVHFIKDWGFDDPAQRKAWDEQDVNQVYRDYFDLLRQSARSKMFDIMGHVDLVKKFGHRASQDMSDEVKKTAQTFKECGVAVEINTSGLRKTCKEMYPALNFLKIYRKAGVPLTFGSDAHQPEHVGADFEAAVALAKEAGYAEYVLFKNRKIERTVKL
ncbi:MAG TPA: histidinol-phosphatase HisJ [Candidatus Omnitrophota bacterium]|nr:histidinol-phosphatase HisJ [Candidatus Omnitrophota bacterium]